MSYQVQSIDTSYAAEQVQIGIFRRRGTAGRGDLWLNLSQNVRWLAWNGLRQRHPESGRREQALLFLALCYGAQLAQAVRNDLLSKAFREEDLMNSDDIFSTILKVADVLEELGIKYLIAGSVASSVHGVPRATADVDLVADFKPEQVDRFIARLEAEYYLSKPAMLEALARHAFLNLISLETGLKLDIFVLKTDAFNQTGFGRAVLAQISKGQPRLFPLDSPEDVLLQKLKWYQAGGQTSNNQWNDVVNILKLQEHLDYSYLEEWAAWLNLTELLTRARQAAGRA